MNTEFLLAILTGILVIITGIYAWRTHVISKAAEQQAQASVKMAEEMREQRYDTVRPVIDIQQPADPTGQTWKELLTDNPVRPEPVEGRNYLFRSSTGSPRTYS